MHGVHTMKEKVSISVERLNYQPVKSCYKMLGRNFSDFVSGCCSILARDFGPVIWAILKSVWKSLTTFLIGQGG